MLDIILIPIAIVGGAAFVSMCIAGVLSAWDTGPRSKFTAEQQAIIDELRARRIVMTEAQAELIAMRMTKRDCLGRRI